MTASQHLEISSVLGALQLLFLFHFRFVEIYRVSASCFVLWQTDFSVWLCVFMLVESPSPGSCRRTEAVAGELTSLFIPLFHCFSPSCLGFYFKRLSNETFSTQANYFYLQFVLLRVNFPPFKPHFEFSPNTPELLVLLCYYVIMSVQLR